MLGRLLAGSALPVRFEVTREGELLGAAALNIPGRYNVTNALGALAVAMEVGVPFAEAAAALAEFKGLENRFSIAHAGGVTIVKDYISHPTGIKRVLESAKDLTQGRIFSVWKPYRYTLLSYLQDQYATAFEGSEEVIITTMYAASEDPIPGIDTAFIVEKIRATGMRVTFVPDDSDVVATLEARVKRGDKVIFFGGDDFFQMADGWARRLTESEGSGPATRG
jgi:UDP-N-acetylmuramate--alanine ligase